MTDSRATAAALPPPLAALLDSTFYPHRPATVELVQTHISFVFLAGDEVFKIKKPVKFSFLDFSTLALRQHFCREEVRLNRRLAPDIYLGVVAISRSANGAYRLAAEDDADAVEFAVRMRRVPADSILANMLDANRVTHTHIDAIAERIAAFHAAARVDDAIRANGTRAAVWAVLQDNFTGARPFRDRTLPAPDDDRIQRVCRTFLNRHAALFAQRVEAQRIRECHGDLHAEHVVLNGNVAVIDCVEFNPRFRNCDVAADVAFLFMDLEYRGYPALARRFVDAYVAQTGDTDVTTLLPFYACYRAYVRGKVDSLKSEEPEVGAADRKRAADSARRHFTLAYRYTWVGQRALIVVYGLSGTGKSVIARALAERTGFALFNSDTIRKEIAGMSPHQRGDAWLYAPERSAETYATMVRRAEEAISHGGGAIVDATFQRRAHRDAARDAGDRAGVPTLFIECDCPQSVVRERLRQRGSNPAEASDADWNVHQQQRSFYESFARDERGPHLLVDTAKPTGDTLGTIERMLQRSLASSAAA